MGAPRRANEIWYSESTPIMTASITGVLASPSAAHSKTKFEPEPPL